MNWIWVFIGGGLGSVVRYGTSLFMLRYALNFPLATLLSNVFAAIIIGILAIALPKQTEHGSWLLLATGFCGGLSTFSTFSLETMMLFRNGHPNLGWLNILLSIVLTLLAVFVILRLYGRESI